MLYFKVIHLYMLGDHRKWCEHNVAEWNNLSTFESLILIGDRSRWREVVSKSMMAPPRPPEVMG